MRLDDISRLSENIGDSDFKYIQDQRRVEKDVVHLISTFQPFGMNTYDVSKYDVLNTHENGVSQVVEIVDPVVVPVASPNILNLVDPVVSHTFGYIRGH